MELIIYPINVKLVSQTIVFICFTSSNNNHIITCKSFCYNVVINVTYQILSDIRAFLYLTSSMSPDRVAQSAGHLTRKSVSWVRYPVWPHTFVSPSAVSRGAVVSYWRKYVHEVLINRLGGLSLPRKSVVRLTDRPDMTLDVYRGRKTTTQQK